MYSVVISLILPDLLSMIMLIFLAFLISRNIVISKESSQDFLTIIFLVMVIIVTEVMESALEVTSLDAQMAMLVLNVVGFIITPIIPILMSDLYNGRIVKKSTYVWIPVVINTVLCLTTPFTGWIFSVAEDNKYSRGPYFFVFVLTSAYSFFLFVRANYRYAKNFTAGDHIYLNGLYMMVVLGNVVQLIAPDVQVIWTCVSISLVLFYIFLRELQFKYDPLTGLLNRQAFQRAMQELKNVQEVSVLVFDLNCLKMINDTYGHVIGDAYITKSSTILSEVFKEVGTCYRVGGDEFCILSKECNEPKIKSALRDMEEQVERIDYKWKDSFHIAHGYAFYYKKDGQDIYDVFAEADQRMYEHKEKSKNTIREELYEEEPVEKK